MTNWIHSILKSLGPFLLRVNPDSHLDPRQSRVTVLALYGMVLASMVATPWNMASDYQSGAYILFSTHLVYLTLLILGLFLFWKIRSLNTIRAFFSLSFLILTLGMFISRGGPRGMGFLYFVAGYSIIYFILGMKASIIMILFIWIASVSIIFLGGEPGPRSLLGQQEFLPPYMFINSVAAILGLFTVVFQHILINYLSKEAYEDPLTKLPNRKKTEMILDELMAQHRGSGTGFSLLAFKINQFSQINSAYGSAFADSILAILAQRLKAQCRNGENPGRYSGTIYFFTSPMMEEAELRIQGKRIMDSLQEPMALEGQQISLGLGLSIAQFPRDAQNREELISRIMANFESLKNHPGGIRFYNAQLHAEELHRMALTAELHNAVDKGELRLVFQPKVHLLDRSCQGAEILLRWDNPLHGSVGPDVFIPLAEKAGLINGITRWVARETLKSVGSLARDPELRNRKLIHAINLSPLDISDPSFNAFLRESLEHYPLDPALLEFEITEGSILQEDPTIQATLNFIRHAGFRLAIDDFGTGYSSLNYLHRIQAQNLKIDRSFIGRINESNPEEPVVDAIISMACSLGMEITAEGVETPFQEAYLKARACTLGQGWLYARAMDLESYKGWLVDSFRGASNNAPL